MARKTSTRPDSSARNILTNPPFNTSNCHCKDVDMRWQVGVPPKGGTNFAWVQHFIHHLGPQGMAGFVLANCSMSSNQSGKGAPQAHRGRTRRDCMVALPGQLFYSTQISVYLWSLAEKNADAKHAASATAARRVIN